MTIISYLGSLWNTFWSTLTTFWGGSLTILPQLVGATLILLIGWCLASFLEGLVKKILNNIPWKSILSRFELHKVLKGRLGLSTDVGAFFGWIVKWILIIASFIAAIGVLQLTFVNEFLSRMIAFLPMAVTAALIVFISFFVGGFMGQVIRRLIDSLNISGGEITGLSLKWLVVIFGIFTALRFLLPTLDTLVSKFADFLLFASALAVGIGASKPIGEWIKNFKGRI